ncbi:hypothetical protein [Dickeya zeae]|uniref:Uncharacterized protein n=2 Tax=Pectobacteriaceae TaxID=1903410 RepID=A0ABX8W2E7_9GAMM|nr:hypothetical protein [Dickeya zeae]QYM92866.1 hypothetical protein FGI21_13845 [Dickeya zeae]
MGILSFITNKNRSGAMAPDSGHKNKRFVITLAVITPESGWGRQFSGYSETPFWAGKSVLHKNVYQAA